MTIFHSPLPSRSLFLLLVAVMLCCLGQSLAEGGDTTGTNKSILFAGDSDIEGWKNTNELYPNSVNRGDGGTTCKQWTKRINKWLTKLDQPMTTTVVLVCGENDLADGDSPSTVFANFQKVVRTILATGATVIYVGTKPEPSTEGSLHNKYKMYDALIRNHYGGNNKQELVMIDVFPAFEELGNPRSLYARDKLHLSKDGYGYWNAWLQVALEDSSGCLRWEIGECVLPLNGDDNDNNNNNAQTPMPTSTTTSMTTSATTSTTTSTLTSTSTCSDNSEFRYQGKKRRNCGWVGEKSGKRCDKHYQGYAVREQCPEACGDC